MKAIILAAGKGLRMGRYTKHMPKGMLQFAGMTLIERQVKTYQECGINDIIIITGHKAEKIKIENVQTIFNKEYATTNMVESLFCAEEEFGDSIIVSYADIVFEPQVLKRLIAHKSDIAVTVDIDWKEYWIARYGSIWEDAESLVFGEDGKHIIEIGKPNPKLREMDGRYVGLIKFTGEGLKIAKNVYHEVNRKYWRTENLKKAYMTDLLQSIVDYGAKVDSLKIERGWLEFDIVDDYEEAVGWVKDGSIKRFLNVEEMKENW